MSRSDYRARKRAAPATPAGGVPPPPADPPSASPTPLRGQEETNQPVQPSGGDIAQQDMYSTAFEFGWQSYLQHGRSSANKSPSFEKVEPELAERWRTRKKDRFPWEAAREIARDAWNHVQDAMAEGEATKSSAR